jgi:3-hydroxypropanoate dehydrogenase
MAHPVNDHALDVIFRDARSQNGFLDKDVPQVLMEAIYDLAKMGPTSANCSPARFVFISSKEGKERLLPLMSEGNRDKTKSAPWNVIIAHDMEFQEKMPELFPHNPGAKNWFDNNREETAFRNGTLQSAYFLIAARALGLDCGPMSGFDMDGVNKEFFENQDGEMKNWKANWICNLGHGDKSKIMPRSPRLAFDEACRVL